MRSPRVDYLPPPRTPPRPAHPRQPEQSELSGGEVFIEGLESPEKGRTPPRMPPRPAHPSPEQLAAEEEALLAAQVQTQLHEGQAVLIQGLESPRLRFGLAHVHVFLWSSA